MMDLCMFPSFFCDGDVETAVLVQKEVGRLGDLPLA
jgi:hypothetical protein